MSHIKLLTWNTYEYDSYHSNRNKEELARLVFGMYYKTLCKNQTISHIVAPVYSLQSYLPRQHLITSDGDFDCINITLTCRLYEDFPPGRSHFLHLEKSYHFLHLDFWPFSPPRPYYTPGQKCFPIWVSARSSASLFNPVSVPPCSERTVTFRNIKYIQKKISNAIAFEWYNSRINTSSGSPAGFNLDFSLSIIL